MTAALEPLFLTAKDAAAYLACSVTEVRRLVEAGELDRVYVGEKKTRHYRIVKASIDAYAATLPTEPRRA